jgi:hypothetical protein
VHDKCCESEGNEQNVGDEEKLVDLLSDPAERGNVEKSECEESSKSLVVNSYT